MAALKRRRPIQLGLEHALHSRPRTHNPYPRGTHPWMHIIIGYRHGLRILSAHRGTPRVPVQ